jgi:hypothetical protein
MFVVNGKTELANQVQNGASCGTESCNITGVRWNFRLNKNNMK